jgi:PAS domain S-box-containing protein
MGLSTRFTAAMVAMVFATAAAIAVLAFHNIESAVLPRALERLEGEAQLMAARLDATAAAARADLAGFRVATLNAMAPGDPAVPDDDLIGPWRDRLSAHFAAALAVKPAYAQLVVAGADGHEILRIDRGVAGGTPWAAQLSPLPRQVGADDLKLVLQLADGESHAFPPKADAPARHDPWLRLATPIYAAGRSVAALELAVDLNAAFVPSGTAANPSRRFFVVDAAGRYLLPADPAGALQPAVDRGPRLSDDFPGVSAMSDAGSGARLVVDRAGNRAAVAVAPVALAGGPALRVIGVAPYAGLIASTRAVQAAILTGGAVAVLSAILLAAGLARSLRQPLLQIVAAVDGFAHGRALAPVPVGASGEIGVLARSVDGMAGAVGERTATLRRNAEIFDAVMASMTDAVVLVDEEARIVFANAAARALLGSRGETGWNLWKETYQHYLPDGVTPLPSRDSPLSRAICGERVDDFELAFRVRGEDTAVHIVMSSRPIRDPGGATKGAVLVFRNVTASKEVERHLRQAQKMDAIGQLTGGIAHDFNNILTVITGMIEILGDAVGDRPHLATIAAMIDEAATRGADLTRQLLAFARKQPLQPRDTDINTLIVDTARLLRPTLGEHVEIESILDDEAWRAMIDATQLSTALLNLAVNARDAMPNGGKLMLRTANVSLDAADVSARPGPKPGAYVMIAVSDTGGGIPKDLIDKVFEPFFTTKEVGRGTGLGLSMVYGFVRQSGGYIKIDSEVGRGTTVKLHLPRSTEPPAAAVLAPPPALPGGHETILVVEDDTLVRDYVVAQLQSLGYAALAAGDAAAALALADHGAEFDLLFTDVIMPGGMNGRQLGEEMVRRRPLLPVLYTSGYAESAVVRHGRLDPDIALLSKPYRKADLARALRQALDVPVFPAGLMRPPSRWSAARPPAGLPRN